MNYLFLSLPFIFLYLNQKKIDFGFLHLHQNQYRAEWQRYFTKSMQLFSYFIYVELQLFTLTFIITCALGFTALQFEAPISKAFLISLADCLAFFRNRIIFNPCCCLFFLY